MSLAMKRLHNSDNTIDASKRRPTNFRGPFDSDVNVSRAIGPFTPPRYPRPYEQVLSKPGDRLRGIDRKFYVRGSSADPEVIDKSQTLSSENQDGTETSDDTDMDSADDICEAEQKVLCFGMIHKARVKLLEKATLSLPFLGQAVPETSLYQFKIFFQNSFFLRPMHLSEGIAILNEETSKILAATDLPSFRLEAYSDVVMWDNLIVNKDKTDTKTILFIDIVLYGSEEIRDEVGKILSSARVYLQHPCYQEPNTEYDNPHFLKFNTNMSVLVSNDAPSLVAVPLIPEGVTSPEVLSPGEQISRAQVRRRVAGVLDSLTRSENLKRLEADIRVRTRLLPHQEEALDFMSQREIGPIPEEYSLWTVNSDNSNSHYQHLITGDKIETAPNETGGGILADDMGLGKTLSVISTIIRTASTALSFADGVHRNTLRDESKHSVRIHSRSTLVLVPSPLLLDGWLQEIKRHCDGSLETKIYHGRGREVDAGILANSDLVLSTYHTVAAEALEGSSPLHQITWFRIVLDEAHIVRRMSTKLYRAVSSLSGNFRWCLTGTPVQNTLEDLASLVAFIRSHPLDNLLSFRKHIVAPLMKGTDQGTENLRLLLDSICLRRTKKLLHLPTAVYEDRHVEFSAAERSHYKSTEADGVKLVKQHCSEARNAKGYFGFFQLHIQLRRLCNHGSHQKPISLVSWLEDSEVTFEVLQQKGRSKCTSCKIVVTGLNHLQDNASGELTSCGHLLCFECVVRYRQALKNDDGTGLLQCPLCPQKIPANYLTADRHSAANYKPCSASTGSYFREGGVSSKILALVNDVKKNQTEGKSIVFSSWTKSLDLVGRYLAHNSIPYIRIDGTYSLSQRQKILEEFDKDSPIQILLMTTGTGAVGLNLTIANCVYLLEPQWNPMVENQAIARVLRLGQEREVKVVRYIMTGTVEEAMKNQQVRKLDLAKLGWEEKE